jgi:hypothetical protein
MDILTLAQDAGTMENLSTAGSALWAIVQANGVSAVVGGLIYHLWLKRGNKLKAKSSR